MYKTSNPYLTSKHISIFKKIIDLKLKLEISQDQTIIITSDNSNGRKTQELDNILAFTIESYFNTN